jgi:hypothetical protein
LTHQRYNNDFWTLEDDLGIARTGDHMAKLALDVPTPFTIGVIGKWGGGGKTNDCSMVNTKIAAYV